MALIKCKECGKEISDTAINCPNCGYVNKESTNIHNNPVFHIVALVCTIISIFINPFCLLSIFAIVSSFISITQSKKSTSLLVCSIFILLVSILITCLYVVNLNTALNNL